MMTMTAAATPQVTWVVEPEAARAAADEVTLAVAGARDEADVVRLATAWAASFQGPAAIAQQAALAIEVIALRDAAKRQAEQLEQAMAMYRKAAHEACTDALTGLANRRGFMDQAERLVAQATRYGGLFSVMVLDIDHFKRFNDTYGHEVGDAVLRRVGAILADRVRKPDLAARLGGEEFVILCPNTHAHKAANLADRIREAVAELTVDADVPAPVTISIGVATCQGEDTDVDDVIARADRALYRAKAAGRNRVEI